MSGPSLRIENRLLSLRGRMTVTGQDGGTAYEAAGAWAFWPTWTITRRDGRQATLKRKPWTWLPVWQVRAPFGEFLVRRRFTWFKRRYQVEGGPYDGAILSGSTFDLKFLLERHGAVLARAAGPLLSLRDRHDILLDSDDPDLEWLTVIAMVIVHQERQSESSHAAAGD
jgi:uncharacterized protein YxjI